MNLENDIPYRKIKDVARLTGISISQLRKGCKDGSIPRIMYGNAYYICVPEFLAQLRSKTDGGGLAYGA